MKARSRSWPLCLARSPSALRDPGIGEKLKALYRGRAVMSPAEFKTHVDAEMEALGAGESARAIKVS